MKICHWQAHGQQQQSLLYQHISKIIKPLSTDYLKIRAIFLSKCVTDTVIDDKTITNKFGRESDVVTALIFVQMTICLTYLM
jgi:hypothetical protein